MEEFESVSVHLFDGSDKNFVGIYNSDNGRLVNHMTPTNVNVNKALEGLVVGSKSYLARYFVINTFNGRFLHERAGTRVQPIFYHDFHTKNFA